MTVRLLQQSPSKKGSSSFLTIVFEWVAHPARSTYGETVTTGKHANRVLELTQLAYTWIRQMKKVHRIVQVFANSSKMV